MALVNATFGINLNFAARLSCNSDSEVVLANFRPGIKIVQNGNKVGEIHLNLHCFALDFTVFRPNVIQMYNGYIMGKCTLENVI